MTFANDTLGHCIDNGYGIYVCCISGGCGNTKLLDLEMLADRLGRDHGAMHNDLIKLGFKCSKCGRREVSFRVAQGGKQHTFYKQDEDKAF